MPRYTLNTNHQIQWTGGRYPSACRLPLSTGGSYFLGCCGLAGIEGFNDVRFTDWQDKAEFMACIYRELFTKGTAVYAITREQLDNPLHQALLECGSTQIAEFPNLYHGPRMMHMFKVNVRNICGRFCNLYGEAYAEPPKDDSEIIPEQTTVSPAPFYHEGPAAEGFYQHGYARFPTKQQG